MSTGVLFGKRTWSGVGVALGVLIVVLLIGALLVVRGILPMDAVSLWLWFSYGLAVFVGGRIAAAGQGRGVCAIVPGATLYVLAWLLALCSDCTIEFSANGLGITVAVAIGVLLALMGGKRRKKGTRKIRRASVKPLRR